MSSAAMQFCSTRNPQLRVSFSDALLAGLASDGGLYVPVTWPRFTLDDFNGAHDLPAIAERLLTPFVTDDRLAPELQGIIRAAFNFAAPLVPLDKEGRVSVLELFHGPTAAFKDFGARFLAECLTRLRSKDSAHTLNILVATSGDTGGAVAAAFHLKSGIEVTVLFPQGLVSPTQERQLTCWGENVRSLAVRGTFDDCQRLVKEAFLDSELRAAFDLSSANSINLGRLLPQCAYYAATSLALWREYGERASFIIPSGNLGNAVACIWARQMGLPIDQVLLAHNANRTVPDFLSSGQWQPRASIATLASAMDVGNPSNVERLRALFPDIESLRHAVRACSVQDAAISERIRADFRRYGRIWCPHTAVAAEAFERLDPKQRQAGHWVWVATAHPGKFPQIVEPLIGQKLELPPALIELFARPTSCKLLAAELDALRSALSEPIQS